jgi:L-amino acid N-acyltransferase YncA
MLIRIATESDLEGIVAIENREIAENWAHFGTSPVSADSHRVAIAGRHPWVVAVDNGLVLGFARSGSWKSREGYVDTTEIGVYVASDYQGRGVGKALYSELFPLLSERGFKTILAGIALPNPSSVRLHEAFGMRQAALFERNGFKFGEWRDVGYWIRHFD